VNAVLLSCSLYKTGLNMRVLTSFIGFALAIFISVYIFAPERIPPGYGLKPVPVELIVENTLAGQLVESVTGQSGANLVIKNTAGAPLNNVTVTLRDGQQNIKNQFIIEQMPATHTVTLGWANQWVVEAGDELEIMASTYYKVLWAL
jgi:hypothetical protein